MRSALVLALLGACSASAREPLFNGRDLTGWSSWLEASGRDNDRAGLFRVDDGMIHVNGVDLAPGQFEFGYLATLRSYDDFRLHFEYRWGERRFVPWGPDSGMFIAVVGPDARWPRSLECQVAAGDTGSVYVFDRVTIATTIDPAVPAPTYRDAGQPYVAARVAGPDLSRVARDGAVDSLTEWNAVDITSLAGAIEIVVNGHTTFRGSDLRQPDPDAPDDASRDLPLTGGRIAIQNEGGEAYYRNLVIETL